MIYLDYAATCSPKPKKVIQAISDYYSNKNGNMNRSSGANDLNIYRDELIDFLSFDEDYRVVYSQNATSSLNLILHGQFFQNSKVHYLVDQYAHNAMLRPIYYRTKNNYGDYSIIKRNNEHELSVSMIIDVLKRNPSTTNVACLNLVSNVTGHSLTPQNLKQINQTLNNFENFHLVLDVSQAVGQITLPKFKQNHKVSYAFSSHKYLQGPSGLGVALIHKSCNDIVPLIQGGTGFDSSNKFMPQDLPERLEAGTYNIATIIGLSASINRGGVFFKTTKKQSMHLATLATEEIHKMSSWKYIETNSNIINIVHESYSLSEVSYILYEAHEIICRQGLHCAPLFFSDRKDAFKNGSIRLSFGYNNTMDDVELLVKALHEFS